MLLPARNETVTLYRMYEIRVPAYSNRYKIPQNNFFPPCESNIPFISVRARARESLSTCYIRRKMHSHAREIVNNPRRKSLSRLLTFLHNFCRFIVDNDNWLDIIDTGFPPPVVLLRLIHCRYRAGTIAMHTRTCAYHGGSERARDIARRMGSGGIYNHMPMRLKRRMVERRRWETLERVYPVVATSSARSLDLPSFLPASLSLSPPRALEGIHTTERIGVFASAPRHLKFCHSSSLGFI